MPAARGCGSFFLALGSAVFFTRFFVQWCAIERLEKVVVLTAFWWLSLAGFLSLLSHALFL
jgi:lipid-A-disaccharide synthase-like uncharacterized protein